MENKNNGMLNLSFKMKSLTKIVVTLVFATLLFTNSVSAQDLRFGFKGGVNLSNMDAKDLSDKNMIIGFNGGLFLKVPISENFAFQPELLYTTKGAELKYDNLLATGTASFKLSYIELPLLAVINITKNINIHGGAYIASLIGANVKNVSDVGIFNFENELEKSDFEAIDYGLVGGVGLDFEKFSIGLRYDYGLTPVGKERPILGRIPDARNSSFQFYLGISIL